jgi:hypothetical protein
LPQDDFIVTEDDKPVKVSYFSYSDIEKIETAGQTGRSAGGDSAGQ